MRTLIFMVMKLVQLNLLVDVGFNRDVAQNTAIYWTKKSGQLARSINEADHYTDNQLVNNKNESKKIIDSEYTWYKIISQYETVFE